jgi:hypothetical protein
MLSVSPAYLSLNNIFLMFYIIFIVAPAHYFCEGGDRGGEEEAERNEVGADRTMIGGVFEGCL